MSAHTELASALSEHLVFAGEDVTTPDGTTVKAIVSAEDLASEFIPGMELGNRGLRIRVARADHATEPATQGLWTVRGKQLRAVRVNPSYISWLINLEDPKN
jgi:hypothetical protein